MSSMSSNYVGDSSSGDDDVKNSRVNFLHPKGNDTEQKGIEFLEAQECQNCRS